MIDFKGHQGQILAADGQQLSAAEQLYSLAD
jgi:hypothetical protein